MGGLGGSAVWCMGVLVAIAVGAVGRAAVRLSTALIRSDAVRAFCASVRSGRGSSVDGLAVANPVGCTAVPRCMG